MRKPNIDWTIKIFIEYDIFYNILLFSNLIRQMELSLKYEVKSSPELSKSLQKDLIVNKLNNLE